MTVECLPTKSNHVRRVNVLIGNRQLSADGKQVGVQNFWKDVSSRLFWFLKIICKNYALKNIMFCCNRRITL